MSVTEKLRSSLGLGPKSDTPRAPLVDDTVDVTNEERAKEQAAMAASEPAPSDDDLLDPMQAAAAQLDGFELSRGAYSLLDRSLDSISKNTGAGLEDPDAVQEAKLRAALIRATGNSLSVAIQAVVQISPVEEAPNAVYSLLYSVMRNALFFANLDYRQAQGMDVYSEDAEVAEWFYRYVGDDTVFEALGHVVDGNELSPDAREADVEPPVGLESLRDRQLSMLVETYGNGASGDRKHLVGADSEDAAEAVVTALSDLRLFFTLTAESFGWDPDRPLPYGNVRNPDGSFTPITDPVVALDATEIKRVASQAKRKERRRESLSKAAEAAQAILSKALGPKNHLRR